MNYYTLTPTKDMPGREDMDWFSFPRKNFQNMDLLGAAIRSPLMDCELFVLDDNNEELITFGFGVISALWYACKATIASSDFAGENNDFADWEGNQCVICREFVGADSPGAWSCPCIILGKDEAIKRTWINLEEKGYI